MVSQEWRQRITCDSRIHHGEPCITGTRISVSIIVASHADFSAEQLLGQYPQLKREDIQAALYFAAEAAHSTLVG